MMRPNERIRIIETRLKKAFNPSLLEVQDDSAEHIGHAGSAHGAGHYTVIIWADAFETLSRMSIHRAVMSVLADLIPDEIHAVRIRVMSNLFME